MNIQKLGLISTVAMLSTAVSLGGCDNTKPIAVELVAKEVAEAVKTAKEEDKAAEKSKEVAKKQLKKQLKK